MGLRDSFGEVGRFDSLVLWHQTLHGRPMTGGFISRLPPRIAAAYQASPVFGPLLRLSAGEDVGTLPGRDAALAAIEQAGVRFLVIDRTTSPVALIAFVRTLNLPRIGGDDRHDVFLVTR
jgi:hypothetical protein